MTRGILRGRFILSLIAAMWTVHLAPKASGANSAIDAQTALKAGDNSTAIKIIKKHAERGEPSAQYKLGVLYSRGSRQVRNLKVAATWYRKAAKQGHVEAQFDLGSLYLRGKGVPQSAELAVNWWRKAAHAGDEFAQRGLGDLYLSGNGVERDLVQAYKWKMLAEPRSVDGRVPWGAFGVRSLTRLLTPKQLNAGQRAVRKWVSSQK